MFLRTRNLLTARTAAAAALAAAGLGAALTLAPVQQATAAPAAADFAYGDEEAEMDLVGTAMDNGNFTTLLAAAKAAGLVETLKGEGPYTLLAPTDDAFAKLPEGTVAELLKPANKQKLTDLLLYHVVDGKAAAEDVMGMSELTTLEGSQITVKAEGDAVMLNDATVTKADVMASNGVIHVIDTVLMPEM